MTGRPVGPKCLLIRDVAVTAAACADPCLEVLVLAAIQGVGVALSGGLAAPSGLLLDPDLVPPRLILMPPLDKVTAGIRYIQPRWIS